MGIQKNRWKSSNGQIHCFCKGKFSKSHPPRDLAILLQSLIDRFSIATGFCGLHGDFEDCRVDCGAEIRYNPVTIHKILPQSSTIKITNSQQSIAIQESPHNQCGSQADCGCVCKINADQGNAAIEREICVQTWIAQSRSVLNPNSKNFVFLFFTIQPQSNSYFPQSTLITTWLQDCKKLWGNCKKIAHWNPLSFLPKLQLDFKVVMKLRCIWTKCTNSQSYRWISLSLKKILETQSNRPAIGQPGFQKDYKNRAIARQSIGLWGGCKCSGIHAILAGSNRSMRNPEKIGGFWRNPKSNLT